MPDECDQSAENEPDDDTGKLDLGIAPGSAHEHRHDLAGSIFLRGNHRLLDALPLLAGKKSFGIHFGYQLPEAPPPPKPPPPNPPPPPKPPGKIPPPRPPRRDPPVH